MLSIKKILMQRDGNSPEEAEKRIEEAKEAMHNYLASGDVMEAEDVCAEFFGLEPDYIMELL